MYAYWLILLTFILAAFLRGSEVGRTGLVAAGPAEPQGLTDPQRKFSYSVALLFIVIIVGLRDRVGGDWSNYVRVYNQIRMLDLGQALSGMRHEPAYTLINWVAAQFGAGMWLVNLICAIPFAYGLIRFSKLQPNPWLPLVVATPFVMTVVGMGYTRQAAALGCFLIGISTILEKKPIHHFVLWTMVGALFHKPVLTFVPLLLLTTTRNRFVTWILVAIAVVIGRFTLLSVAVESYMPGYVQQEYNAAGAFVRVMMNVVPAMFVLLFPRRFLWTEEERNVWKTFAYMCVAAGVALYFISSNVIVDRLAIYLVPIQLFVYARIGYAFGLVRRGWLPWMTLIGLYAATALFVWLNYGVNSIGWIPYRNYLIPTPQHISPY